MITITDAASAKVGELIKAEGEEELALRVAVRPGGCSGFSYEMFFDSDFADDDSTTEHARREGCRRCVQRDAARGRIPRLQGRPRRVRVLHQQPECRAHLRLRPVLQLVRNR